MKYFLSLFIAVSIFLFCNKTFVDNSPESPMNWVKHEPLSKRGWSLEKREFIEKRYKDSQEWLIRAFLEKRPTMGMPKEMIVFMYGNPNKNVNDTLWYYLDEDNIALLIVKFNYNNQVIYFEEFYRRDK